MNAPQGSYINFIATEFESRKARNPHYSLRAFARDLGMAAPKLSDVLRGKGGISESRAALIAAKLKLSEKETTTFIQLVASQHARSELARKQALAKLETLKGHAEFAEMGLESFKIISDWYHFAILELTEVIDFQSNPEWIAKKLNISISIAHDAIKRLFDFGLLIEDENKNWKQTEAILATPSGIPSLEIRKHHRQILQKAEESLTNDDINERDFSSLTFSVSEDSILYAKEEIKKFRRDLTKKLTEIDKEKNRVYCLAIQYFPLDKCKDKNTTQSVRVATSQSTREQNFTNEYKEGDL